MSSNAPPTPLDYRRIAMKGSRRAQLASPTHSNRPGRILNPERLSSPSNAHHPRPQLQLPDDSDDPDLFPTILLLTQQFTSILLATISCIGLSISLALLYCFIRPFSRSYYRHLSQALGATTFLDAMALALPNTKISITGDSDIPPDFGTSIVVSNHLGEIDWWIIMMIFRCIGIKGSVKLFLHRSYKQIPFVGVIFKLLDFPFLGDEWSSYRDRFLKFLKTFNEDTNPVLFLLFPEGGQLDERTIRQSTAFALKEGRPNLNHLLLPRTTGFNATLDSLRPSHPCIYDMTIVQKGYKGKIPRVEGKSSLSKLWKMIRVKDTSEGEVHVQIKRYSLDEVLRDGNWLDVRWADKDRLLSHFSRHQRFPVDTRGFAEVKRFNTRSYGVLNSITALGRLLGVMLAFPVIVLCSIPVGWVTVWVWVWVKLGKLLLGVDKLLWGTSGNQLFAR